MNTTTSQENRRHDLDALRAFAMLLGIVLHGALSMAPIPWLVEDDVRSHGMGMLNHFIHVFRMPLFFLLSGYFSMLLWQRRGLGGLLRQRALRIFLPLFVAIFTVLPLLAISVPVAWGLSEDAKAPGGGPSSLHWAVGHGDVEECERLLESGSDPNLGDDRGSTPLHWAIFFGREQAALTLVDAGADLKRKNVDGRTPLDELMEPWTPEVRSICEFLSSLLQLEVDLDEVPAARARIATSIGLEAPMLVSSEELNKEETKSAFELEHLWFLWYLTLLTSLLAPLFALLARASHRLSQAAASPLTMLALIPATAFLLKSMSNSTGYPLFGPNTSIVLKPDLLILTFYGLFFGFGALLRLVDPDTRRITRRWPVWILIALVAFPMALHATFEPQDGETSMGAWAALLQAVACWGLVIGLLGAFQRVLSKESRFARLVSDSSYWIYLMHLPLVIILQGLVSHWQASAALKLLTTCSITFVTLFATYLVFVRPTPIGWMLNGRQPRRKKVD